MIFKINKINSNSLIQNNKTLKLKNSLEYLYQFSFLNEDNKEIKITAFKKTSSKHVFTYVQDEQEKFYLETCKLIKTALTTSNGDHAKLITILAKEDYSNKKLVKQKLKKLGNNVLKYKAY